MTKLLTMVCKVCKVTTGIISTHNIGSNSCQPTLVHTFFYYFHDCLKYVNDIFCLRELLKTWKSLHEIHNLVNSVPVLRKLNRLSFFNAVFLN